MSRTKIVLVVLLAIWLGGAVFFGSVMFALTHQPDNATFVVSALLWLRLVGLGLAWPFILLRGLLG